MRGVCSFPVFIPLVSMTNTHSLWIMPAPEAESHIAGKWRSKMSYLEIELTAADWRNEPTSQEDGPATPSLRVVGVDDLENEVVEEVAPPTPQTFSVAINVDDIREYYPRKGNRPGTRVVFRNGAARPVMESYAEVRAKILAARSGHAS